MHWELVKLRKAYNVNQEDMGVLLGISTSTYGNKENGKSDFKLEEIFIIARFFNKNIEDIFLPNNISISDIKVKNGGDKS